MIETSCQETKALVVIPAFKGEEEYLLKRREEEANSLLETLGITPLSTLFFNVKEISSAFLIGKGQLGETKEHALFFDVDLVYFDTELKARVTRNLEEVLEREVLDRNELIIEIFASRARSREARLQVALAKLQFLLPRLKQRGNPYAQQRGGVRGAKGEGERQIELDRRRIESEIVYLKKEIAEVKKQRETQRKKRLSSKLTFALAGYTNSGKSSLLKALTGYDTFCEDRLFATLDPLEKQLEVAQGLSVILADTVGFVSNLPHTLIEAFSSTLEEAALADEIILVLDSSAENILEHYETTISTLEELGAGDKKMTVVFNKCDKSPENDYALALLKAQNPDGISVSATRGDNLDLLREKIRQDAISLLQLERLAIPSSETKEIEEVYKTRKVVSASYNEKEAVFLVEKNNRGPSYDEPLQ